MNRLIIIVSAVGIAAGFGGIVAALVRGDIQAALFAFATAAFALATIINVRRQG